MGVDTEGVDTEGTASLVGEVLDSGAGISERGVASSEGGVEGFVVLSARALDKKGRLAL